MTKRWHWRDRDDKTTFCGKQIMGRRLWTDDPRQVTCLKCLRAMTADPAAADRIMDEQVGIRRWDKW